ncbi:MAG: hypothetical protein JWO79_1527 [Actinomycetia bacterium]|jgi:hypothetical protein|nr:hypothetical protein [Actinomycetes bacterium]MDQ1654501.1 hypothetical protein [Cryptosporangiaceae bacterium]MDQ1655403.1 hypothetical protein [Cryptosporangiaceae bacterium]
MTEGALCLTTSSRWAAALERVPHDLYHRPEYVAFDAEYARGTAAAYCYESGGHVLLIPLVLRPIPGTGSLDASSPYGYPAPVSDTDDPRFWAEAVSGLVPALREAGAVSCFVRLHPLLPAVREALATVGPVEYHGDTVSIDLRLGDEDAWHHVRANHRRQINRARREGRRIVIGDWSYLTAFTTIYLETMRRVCATEYYFFPPSYFTRLREAAGDRIHLAVALDGDEPIAGAVIFEDSGIVQYHLGGTRSDRLGEQPSKLLIHEVGRWARERGNTAFHLGSGVGGRDNPLFHFKAGFSPLRHPFHTWRVIADPDRYRQLTAATGDDGGYFPAYRAPQAQRPVLHTERRAPEKV